MRRGSPREFGDLARHYVTTRVAPEAPILPFETRADRKTICSFACHADLTI
jgi:hypothetical protein